MKLLKRMFGICFIIPISWLWLYPTITGIVIYDTIIKPGTDVGIELTKETWKGDW